MRKAKFDRKTEKTIMKLLDGAVKKYGMADVRHAANKWGYAQREKASLSKAKEHLEKKLAELKEKLS